MNDEAIRQRLAQSLTSALSSAVEDSKRDPLPAPLPPPSKAISFAPDLVRALIAGRKTVTRRIVRPHPTRRPSIAKCPIAQPGDRLHVREPWAEIDGRFVYLADRPIAGVKFKPAMYMPRRAARLMLAVTAVSAERLHAITPAAARAEGCPIDAADPSGWFAALWDSLHAAPGERWVDDPFVWAITFTLGTV